MFCGGAAPRYPTVNNYRHLYPTPIGLQETLSKQNIRVSIPAQFTVSVSNKSALMVSTAKRLLGLGDSLE